MFFTVKKEDVIDGLQKAAGIIASNRTGATALRSIWLKAHDNLLTIMATDTNIEFTGNYPAEVKEEGLTGVNGRSLVDLVRRLPSGELRIGLEKTPYKENSLIENSSSEASILVIEQGRRTYKLPANDSTWFQKFSEFSETDSVVWSGDFLQETIDRVFFCINDDDSTDALACLYIKPFGNGIIEACGLNGHQFALTKFTHDDLCSLLPPDGILIQRKNVSELRKWLGENEILLSIKAKRLYIRSSNGQEMLSLPREGYLYPDYSAFMKRLEISDVTKLVLNRKEALEALDRIAIFNTEQDRGVYFELSANEASLSAQGPETGSAHETIGISCEGPITRIVFPTRNLMEILSHYQSEEILLTLTGTEGPCGITGKNDNNYTVIIMPMKVSEEVYYSDDE